MIVIFVFLLFAGAYGVKKIFGYSIEESLFINILFIIAFLLIMGLAGVLTVGFYIILVLFFGIFVFGLLKEIKRKTFDIYEVLTPGISVFLISCLLYFISVKSLGFYWWDEASHWGTAVRHMYLSNQMYYGLQTMGVPMFSYFMVKVTGYSEGLVYLSRWIFMWSAIAILMKDVTWKSWYVAAIGAFLSACIFSAFASEPVFYMDTPLGVISAVIISNKILNKDFEKKDFILTLLGIFVIAQIKYGTGVEFAFFVCVFVFIDELIRSKKKISSIYKFVTMLGLCIIAYLVSSWSKTDIPGYFASNSSLPLDKFYGLLLTKSTLAFILAFFCGVGFAFIAKYNRKISSHKNYALIKYSNIFLISVVSLVLVRKVLLALVLSLDAFARDSLLSALRRMFYEAFYSNSAYILLLYGLIFTIIIGWIIKNENKKRYIVGNLTVFVLVLIYGILLALSYAFLFEKWESLVLMSYRRYYGSAIVFMSIFVLSGVLYRFDLFKSKPHWVFASISLALIFLKSFPLPNNLLFKQADTSYISYEYGIKKYGEEAAQDINKIIPMDSDVFIICQNNGAFWADAGVANWIHYYIAPRNTNFVDFSFGESYSQEDLYTENIDADDLLARISNYDYVYIDNADETFYSKYGKIFNVLPGNSRAVYEYTNGSLILTWEGDPIREE